MPHDQPDQIIFTGQLSYVLSGLIGEHLTIVTTSGAQIELRLTGWDNDPYTLPPNTSTGPASQADWG